MGFGGMYGSYPTFKALLDAARGSNVRVSGRYLPQLLPPPAPAPPVPPPTPIDYDQAKGEYGHVIPISFGTRRMPGQMIYASQIYGSEPDLYVDLFVSFGYNGDADPSETEVTKLWAGGSRIYNGGVQNLPGDWSVTLYSGTETQTADPDYAAAVGAANAPAFRNQILAFVKKLPLEPFNYVIPGISAEVTGIIEEGGTTLFTSFGTGVSLSGTNTIEMAGTSGVANAGSVQASALGNLSHTTGKYYLEYAITSIPPEGFLQSTSFPQFGLAMTTHDVEQPLTSGSTGMAVTRNGNMFAGAGGGDPAIGSIAVGDRVGVAVDLDNGLIWLRNGTGGSWYGSTTGDPALGTNGYDYSEFRSGMVGAALVPAIGVWQADESATGYFAAGTFLGTAPVGFDAWDDTVPASTSQTSTVAELLSRLATYAGLDADEDIDIDAAITDTITGALITEETNYEDVVKRLGRAFGFDMFAADKIMFVKPVSGSTYSVDVVVPSADLGDQGDRTIMTTRGEDNSPVQMALSYIDLSQQFRWATQRARRILFPVRSTQSRRRDGFSIPVIITASRALTLAATTMFREADQNVSHQFTLPAEFIKIQPGDILTVTAGDTAYDVKVTKVMWRPDWQIGIEAVNLFADEDIELDSEAGTPSEPYEGTTPPTNTVLPAISGTAEVMLVLTTDDGTWTGSPTPTFTYQWYSDGVAIVGQDGAAITLTYDEVGTVITVIVTATNSAGTASATSDPTLPVGGTPLNTVLPTIDDTTPSISQTLTASTGTWQAYPAPAYTYQWRWADTVTNIGGATSSTYVVQAGDAGHTLDVRVTATNSYGATTATSAATAAVAASTAGSPIGLLLTLTKAT